MSEEDKIGGPIDDLDERGLRSLACELQVRLWETEMRCEDLVRKVERLEVAGQTLVEAVDYCFRLKDTFVGPGDYFNAENQVLEAIKSYREQGGEVV